MKRMVLVALVLGGCVTDKPWTARPVRFNAGISERHLATAPPVTPSPADSTNLPRNVARSTDPTTSIESSDASPSNATVGAAEFTLALRYHAYAGGGLETGTLGRPGSSIAAIYGVVGAESTNSIGALAVELAAGWQTMRADVYSKDFDSRILEPRVRGELWLSSQFTLGASVGGMPGGDSGWVAGVYVGVHSNVWDVWGQRGLPKNDPDPPAAPPTDPIPVP
jgi:hypothetical protein